MTDCERYREALERLASAHAFGLPHVIEEGPTGDELKDRMAFSQMVLDGKPPHEAAAEITDRCYAGWRTENFV